MACKGILVVEDDQDIRESVQQLLEFEGFEVHTAQNGREALEIIDHLQYPCLILLDLMMPVMNGWEFLEVQKNNNRIAGIPVVVATASEDAKAKRANALLRKPIDVEQLLDLALRYCSAARRKGANHRDKAA